MTQSEHNILATPTLATPTLATTESDLAALTKLEVDLLSNSAPKQLRLVSEIAQYGHLGYKVLQNYLISQRNAPHQPTFIQGRCYEILHDSKDDATQTFLLEHFPQGVVPLLSERAIDYLPLQKRLVQKEYLKADQLTLEKLCELAGEVAIRRKWVYFTDVEQMPMVDLQTLNQLWLVHSEGKFGFSIQRQLWLSVGRNWENLWPKIAWKSGRTWSRYPEGFIWDLDAAPKGHLPLFNQLRGVQAFNALLCHPAWGT